MTSEFLVTIVEAILMLTVAILGGFFVCWQQAIIAFICSPIIIGGTVASMRINWGRKKGGSA